MSYRGNMKRRMGKADAAGAAVALIIGDDEVAAGEVTYKDLATGEQKRLSIADLKNQPLSCAEAALPTVSRLLKSFG